MIRTIDLSISAGDRRLLHHLHLHLPEGWTALVGPNGVGKTCLARVLAGLAEPEAGQILRETSVVYLPQNEERPEGTIDEALQELWQSGSALLPLMHELCGDLEPSRRFLELSGGEWLRLRLARRLMSDPGYLILDEPTNHLDRRGREALFRFLETWEGSGLLISHDRVCLSAADRVAEISHETVRLFETDFEEYHRLARAERAQREDALDRARRENRRAERERSEALERQQKRMRQGQKAAERGGLPKILLGGRKRRAQMTLAKTDVGTARRVKKADEDRRELWLATVPEIRMRLDAELVRPGTGEQLFHVEDLVLTDGSRDLWNRGLTFTLRGPGRWAILGSNGSGKSSLLRRLAGEEDVLSRFRGTVQRTRSPIRFLRQEERGSETVLDWVAETSAFDRIELRNRLADFALTGETAVRPLSTLSGGERMRAFLARAFLAAEPPKVLLLDEPSNDLDLVNLETLESFLQDYEGAVLLVSHDASFLEGVDAEILVDLDGLTGR